MKHMLSEWIRALDAGNEGLRNTTMIRPLSSHAVIPQEDPTTGPGEVTLGRQLVDFRFDMDCA